MRARIRTFLLPALASLMVIGIGFLGYATYNNGYVSGYEYDYSIGYDSGYSQDKGKFEKGYNCGHKVSYQEATIASENVSSDSQTVELKNQTFKEVRDFILKDPTNRNKFILNQYECRHFATQVNNNAQTAGLRCAFVLICYDRGQHAVVAFDTTDRGLVYIEPQTDAAIHPQVGGKYQGKEITEILIAW